MWHYVAALWLAQTPWQYSFAITHGLASTSFAHLANVRGRTRSGSTTHLTFDTPESEATHLESSTHFLQSTVCRECAQLPLIGTTNMGQTTKYLSRLFPSPTIHHAAAPAENIPTLVPQHRHTAGTLDPYQWPDQRGCFSREEEVKEPRCVFTPLANEIRCSPSSGLIARACAVNVSTSPCPACRFNPAHIVPC
jgi:hypothetical protein